MYIIGLLSIEFQLKEKEECAKMINSNLDNNTPYICIWNGVNILL